MPAAPLRFYFDYISSNAYLAWLALEPLAQRFERSIELVPTLFAGLLESTGQLGPAEIPPKIRWMSRNNLRKAALLGLTLRPPLTHPFHPLLALRASSVDLPEPIRRRFVTGLFRATWTEQRDPSDPAVVAAVADAAGADGKAVVAAAGTPDVKARLRRQTDDAIAAGVFGVPTVIADGELFWGYDDFPFVERFLDGRDPLDPEEARAWSRPQRPSAMRARQADRPPLRIGRVDLPARDPEALAQWWATTFGLEGLCARADLGIGLAVPTRDEVAVWARRLGTAVDDGPHRASTRARDPEGNAVEIYWEAPSGARAGSSGTR
jgi:2-hydroxychromene-2-carboxylate isomerase